MSFNKNLDEINSLLEERRKQAEQEKVENGKEFHVIYNDGAYIAILRTSNENSKKLKETVFSNLSSEEIKDYIAAELFICLNTKAEFTEKAFKLANKKPNFLQELYYSITQGKSSTNITTKRINNLQVKPCNDKEIAEFIDDCFMKEIKNKNYSCKSNLAGRHYYLIKRGMLIKIINNLKTRNFADERYLNI